MAQAFDPIVKTLVETEPQDWLALIGQPRAPTDVIDADIASVSGAADKVLRVGARPPYLLHLEFVAGHDAAQLPHLLHFRGTLLEHRHELLVRSVAVLLRPEADSPQLTGVRLRAFPGEEPHDSFRYQMIRVWQLPVEGVLAGGVGTLPLAPISAVTAAELPGIIERMRRRLGRRSARVRPSEIWSATYILMGLRYSPQLAEYLLQGVVSMEESSTYQAILARGEVQGKLAEAKRMLRLQGSERFGPPAPRVAAALDGINDVQRLEELGVRLLNATSWEELLDLLTPRRRGRRSGTRGP